LKWITSEILSSTPESGADIEIEKPDSSWRYGILGPKAKLSLSYDANRLEILGRRIPRIADRQEIIVWKGVIRYRDIFPKTSDHVTKFCYVLQAYRTATSVSAPYVLACGDHKNCADDECALDKMPASAK
jgi:hypothetical protein